jgi:hypothetical protein
LDNNRNSTIKPAHVQFNKISDDKVLVIRVNIDAFGMFLKHLGQTKHLEPYFNKYLEAYEFDLDEAIKELNCIFSKVYNY